MGNRHTQLKVETEMTNTHTQNFSLFLLITMCKTSMTNNLSSIKCINHNAQ